MRPPPIGIVIGVFLSIALGVQSARRPRVVSLPMPTSETIPYVAEVMGATSYEEVVEDDDKFVNGNKRVQRKLNLQAEGERELDPEYQEYQGNKTRVMGRPGVDFPVLPNIPRTEFNCRKVKKSGYYADLDTGCQVFHICDGGRKISFLCPNGTIFRQSHLICDWWFRVDCERSVELYDESAEQLAHDQMIYKKRAEEIARVMKTTTTALPTTERTSNFRNSRRKNERPSAKPVDLSLTNQGTLAGNQISEAFVDSRAAFTKTNQATKSSRPSGEPKINSQPPSFGYNIDPTPQPLPISYSEQRSTHIVQEHKAVPGGTNYQNAAGGSYNSQDLNSVPTGPQHTYQQPPVATNPNAEQVYQQANTDFNNLGLSTADPPINNYQQETGNTNYKFSYTSSTVGQSSSSSVGAPKDFTKNQVVSQQTAYHQEKESQIPAETAAFGSSRHRFANQLEQGYQNDYPIINSYTAIPTTTSTEIPSTSTISTGTYNAGSVTHQSGSTTYNQHSASDYKSDGSPGFSNQGSSTFNSAGTTTYSNGESSSNGGPAAYNTVSSPSYNGEGATYNTGSADYNSAGTFTYNEPAPNTYEGGTNGFVYETKQNTVLSTRGPPTTKPVNRGTFKHHNSNNYQSSQHQYQYQQTSAPYSTSTLNPSSSQVYNSHMQPYSSLNQDAQFGKNKHGDQPVWNAPPSTLGYSTVKDSYRGESSNQGFSTYNSYTTGQSSPTFNSLSHVKDSPSSTVKPYRGKTVFNVKIRPNKDYSLLELHRLHPTKSPTSTSGYTSTTVPPFVTSERTSSYGTYASQPTATYTPPSTVYTSNVPQTNTILSTFPSTQHQYATVNITGTPEEIRPENVNSLMDTGIKPTSADALHTFASIYSSAETDVFYDTTGRPQVSDVILTIGPSTTEEPTTTVKPITSTNGDELPSELSKNTKDSYSYLFSGGEEPAESHKDDLTPKESGSAISDLNKTALKQINKQSKTTIKTSETTTSKPQESTPKFRDSSELRELAQVFSRALSAYLEDPEAFKEILAQVRPTEPNPSDSTTTNPDDEVLDFSDASQTRTGTTEPPGTTIFNTDDVTADISIGEINNLVPSAKLVEPDISYETNSIPTFTSQSVANIEFTTPTAPPEINIVSSGSGLDYDSKLGTQEDTSYFPTAGGVNDESRPRYGGFHNNTRRKFNSYSPYGAELRNNVTTGTPITESSTVPIPSTTPYTTIQYTTSESTTLPPPSSLLPAAQQVNNLVASHNILYGKSAQFTSSSEEEFDRTLNSDEQEKLLLTSGSQSLVSSQNYASFAQNFNKQGQKLYGKDTFANYAPTAIAEDPSAISNEYFKGDNLPYFGQEPPFESISEPSAFQTQTPNFGDKIVKNRTDYHDINTQASVNSFTIDSRNVITSKSLDQKNVISDRMGTFGADSTEQPTWTVSPFETTQYFSSSSVELSPSGSGYVGPSSVKPTTYHPHHQSEVTTEESVQPESTTATPTTTVQDTTTTEGTWPTTISPENPEYHSLMQTKAKEMFGMLNETAATMLMQVMTQAENNMTIRKLILLLVDDRTKDKTEEKTRTNLINALLTHENDIEEVTTVASPTPAPKKKLMKIMRVRAGSGRSLKVQRALDSQTAVAGSNTIRNVTESNKANAAKLYIPSGPAATLKPTTTPRPPTSTLTPKLPYDSDARALELLKTLYNLAAKWG